MILLINFAPINFMGGAEQWMIKIQKYLQTSEDTYVLSVNNRIASIYSQVVLGRTFSDRDTKGITKDNLYFIFLSWRDFIPFTPEWHIVKNCISNARLIYIRFEILELFLVWYFGGTKAWKKTIAGIHSAYIYSFPHGLLDRLHNAVYTSFFIGNILKSFRAVHTLTNRNDQFFKKKFNLSRVITIPNSSSIPKSSTNLTDTHRLKVLFIGELSEKKGIQTLLQVAQRLPQVDFSIAGDGMLRNAVKSAVSVIKNCNYYSHISKKEVSHLYQQHDLLFLPSIAEGLPFVFLEALSYGLTLVNNKTIALNIREPFEFTSEHNLVSEYVDIINLLQQYKHSGLLKKYRHQTKQFFKDNFSDNEILPEIEKKIFAID